MKALAAKAGLESDTDAARRMQEAKRILFAGLTPKKKTA